MAFTLTWDCQKQGDAWPVIGEAWGRAGLTELFSHTPTSWPGSDQEELVEGPPGDLGRA